MATHQSKAQKETVERVMHEFKHGELKTSRGKKVKNPKQAIAIGLHEAGASKYESKEKNQRNLKRTKARERRGATEMDRDESGSAREPTRLQLYEQAKRRNIPGRSKMR
jgi:hypothetical protein